MAEVKTIRLNRVLRELNISLDRAVEHLKSKGHEIERRPTAKISEEVYEVLLDEFQSDRKRKVASKEVGAEKKKEKEDLRDSIEEKEDKVKATVESVKAKTSLKGLKQVGKIELEKEKADAEENGDKQEKEEPIEAHGGTPEKEAAAGDENTDPPSTEATEDKGKDNEEKIPEHIQTRYRKLEGPKVSGEKIDVDKFKKDKKEKSKKKRKRIHKPLADLIDDKGGKNKKRKRKKPVRRDELSEEEIQSQVRETLEKLQGKSGKGRAAKYRREKRDTHREKTARELEQQEADSKTLKVTEFIAVNELATMMDVPVTDIISACMSLGMMVTMNQRLDAEILSVLAEEFGYEIEFISTESEEVEEAQDDPEDLKPRAPIVTVMGHVDHGKTSLLDYIRQENVIAGESGGITQHIGAYSVELGDGQRITFLDTPGHEAFTAMRARGAKVTDLAIIVIAADDDVMPQTKEAISHAQAAGVPIVFAINKIDRPEANPDKIKEALAGMDLLVEDWGGKIQSHDISAKKGNGINELLEKVLLEAELLELKANPDKAAIGTIVEAYLDKGRGYVATVLVQAGTLKTGDYVLAGRHSGKIKAMHDERGNTVQIARPSTPVSILGLDGAPQAGDKFRVYQDEKEAKSIAARRTQLQREQTVRTQRHITLDEIGRRIALGDFKELNIVLKGDVDGSVEALTDSFQKLSTEEIQIKIIHKGVGAITESDVLLASASDAVIIGFNVRPMGKARQLAETEKIDIRLYSIIYDAINDLKDAMEGMLAPELKEEITGTAEIREIFKISKVGTIAGCMVTGGKIYRDVGVRIIREGVVVYTGELESLKRFKDDVKEVAKGYDCGMQVKNYNDIREGDIIEAFKEVEVKKTL